MLRADANTLMMVEHRLTDGEECYHVGDLIVMRSTGAELLSTYTDRRTMYVIE